MANIYLPFLGQSKKKNFRQEEKKSWQIFFGKLSLYIILAWKGNEFMFSFGTVTNQNVMTEVPVICYISTRGHKK